MNFSLSHIPARSTKSREDGLTMVMDKGISLRQSEDMISVCGDLVDVVKLGFGTAYVTPNLKEKIAFYRKNDIKVYFGGTLFEAFIARGRFKDYCKLLDKFDVDMAEVSDGSINMTTKEKCKYIGELAKDRTVFSEVGSKESGILISPAKWVNMMRAELDAGSWKVIAEARESGTVGIYRPSGHAHTSLVNKIMAKIPSKDILWEAPLKSQQVWFIKQIGANVNLGNIAPEEVIPLETLRLGLRGDTFFQYVPEEVVKKLQQVVPVKN
ncbi:MAG: phosphosulfolactate synthase [Flavobacteriales bacterium]|nr:phosphosulfolactate synthase [Flavobacteriales bacterium]MBK6945346.1 phosphosulfolactate synthase [Flavobacteriales bacterium]MBK7241459.1 phosphosulfolactate synthase [Flavobacteriales bacterium]MBK7298502.1 phosphosulfolactate synthase [Flavobacteriales bacterium]MBK9535096.1 phosphosulfolactate synthase [Flavobacteriales bacterium]